MNRWYIVGAAALVIVAIAGLSSPPDYEPLLPDADHVKGAGAIEIVEYSDFQCPACGAAFPHLTAFMEQYGDRARLTYTHFPLTGIHPFAFKAAEAAECAADQGRFWEYHDMLFENQQALAVPDLKATAAQLGLDTGLFTACLDSGAMAARVTADMAAGQAAGVRATPTFFINGIRYEGVQTVDQLRTAAGL